MGRLHQRLRRRLAQASAESTGRSRTFPHQPRQQCSSQQRPQPSVKLQHRGRLAGSDQAAIPPVHQLGIFKHVNPQRRRVPGNVAATVSRSRHGSSTHIVSLYYNSIPPCSENAGRLIIITDDEQPEPGRIWYVGSAQWSCNWESIKGLIYPPNVTGGDSIATTNIFEHVTTTTFSTSQSHGDRSRHT